MRGDYPSETEALEPAWSVFVQPILPQVLDFNLSVSSIPGPLWTGLAGVCWMPINSLRIAQPNRFACRFFWTAQPFNPISSTTLLDGGVTYNPDAQFGAVGRIDLTINNLRPVIGAMQQGARVPNTTLSQALTLASIGLATIMGMADRTDDGQMRFALNWGAGLPQINGRDLPVRF